MGGQADTQKLYKPFKEGYLHSSIYDKVFTSVETLDPYSQAFKSYKKEVVMDTAEEEKLERL